MPSRIAAHFEALRHRFPAESALIITNAQRSFEVMEAMTVADRPPGSRCAFFEIAGTKFLAWEMDNKLDRFQVFATAYNIPLGILHLSTKPSGTLIVAGFSVDLRILCEFIQASFKAAPAPEQQNVDPAARKLRLLLFGFYESFGHHFWNEVNGLAAIMETGQFDAIDGFIVGPFDYFYLEPFLRAKGKQVFKFKGMGTLLPDQLLIYNNHVVTEEGRRLILDHAATQEPPVPPPAKGKRSICFQIRRHRRSWIHEEDKLVELIHLCAREWPDTTFYIDGHSSSKGAVPIYQANITKEATFVSQLTKRLDGSIDVQLTVGMDINAKINLLRHVDLFVGPIGSGGVLSSWLLRKPTICYGPRKFYDLVAAQEGSIPEGGPMAFAIPPDKVTDSDVEEYAFDVDVGDIMDLIRQEMRKREAV